MSVGHKRTSRECLKKHARTSRTTTQVFPGLSVVYNFLSGPFSLLREP
jgi:hypothetical protein